MLLLFVLWVVVAAGAGVSGRQCTKVNGVSGACELRLNYFTLAGKQYPRVYCARRCEGYLISVQCTGDL